MISILHMVLRQTFLYQCLLIFLFTIVLRSVQAEEDSKSAQPVPSVLVQRVESQSFAPSSEFIGRVEALEKVELRARIKGFLGPRLFKDGEC